MMINNASCIIHHSLYIILISSGYIENARSKLKSTKNYNDNTISSINCNYCGRCDSNIRSFNKIYQLDISVIKQSE